MGCYRAFVGNKATGYVHEPNTRGEIISTCELYSKYERVDNKKKKCRYYIEREIVIIVHLSKCSQIRFPLFGDAVVGVEVVVLSAGRDDVVAIRTVFGCFSAAE